MRGLIHLTDCARRTGRVVPRSVTAVRPHVLVAFALAVILSLLSSESAIAQNTLPRVTVEAELPPGETQIPKGSSVVFIVSRSGDTDEALDAAIMTREPQRRVSILSIDDNETVHDIRFRPGHASVAVRVPALGGTRTSLVPEYIQADVVNRPSDYLPGVPVTVGLRDLKDDEAIINIKAVDDSIDEGDNAEFTLTRTGDTTSTLTVSVRVEDPGGAMTGNHWDDPLDEDAYVKELTFAAAAETVTASFPTRTNLRDTGKLALTAKVLQDDGHSYWVGATFMDEVTVTDDDTAVELSLSADAAQLLEGESVTFTVTRHGDATEAERYPYFYLQVRSDPYRWWNSIADTVRNYGVEMIAGQSSKETRVRIPFDSDDFDFQYVAEIRTSLIPEEHMHEYLVVRGSRKITIPVTNVKRQEISFVSIGSGLEFTSKHDEFFLDESFYEGREVPFVIQRSGSAAQLAEELEVRVRYKEPYHHERVVGLDSTDNPSLQDAFVTFGAGETQASGSVYVTVDDVDEPRSGLTFDYFTIEPDPLPFSGYVANPVSHQYYDAVNDRTRTTEILAVFGLIYDVPSRVSIALAGEDTSITEGEDAGFVLTRFGSMDDELTVRVSIADPGHFRRGDHGNNVPDGTLPVTFAAGADTATLTVSTSDDARDIPDNTLTATVLLSLDNSYGHAKTSEGETSASITVTDNDVAPQVALRASAANVMEGQEAYFELTRMVDSRNGIELPVNFGLRGEQEFQVYGLGPEETSVRIHVHTEDDEYDDPDERVYTLLLAHLSGVPEDERSQYWTITGSSSATITVSDNDLPLVGVEAVRSSYAEDSSGSFRLTRAGQTSERLSVKGRVTETGNSLADTVEFVLEGESEYTFPASAAARIALFPLQERDGDEKDTSVTFELVAGDGYRIDPDKAVATFTVTDTDPTPTLEVESLSVSENAGTIEFRVTLSSSVSPPSLQTVTVDYATKAGTATAGQDYTPKRGTLTFAPEQTSGVISIPILDNLLVDGPETFSLVLSNPVNAELQDGQTTLTVTATITDNEPVVTVEAVQERVTEGEPARFRFTRSVSDGQELDDSRPLTVYFDAGYEEERPEWMDVEIPANESSVIWEHSTEGDDFDGPDSRFGVVTFPISWPGAPSEYSIAFHVVFVTVEDDDLPVVTLEAAHEGRTEGEAVVFTLTRVGQIDEALTVKVSVTQTSDNAGEQAAFISGTPPTTITFAADSATATLSVPTTQDSTIEPHATIAAAIIDEDDDGYRAGDSDSASVHVIDDDRQNSTSLSISEQSGVVDEGEDAVFIVERSKNFNVDLVARVRVTEVKRAPLTGPGQGGDLVFSVTDREVAFKPGDVRATLTVGTEDESLNDGNSRIKATLLLSPVYGISPYPGIANIWVRDDDIFTVSFAEANVEHVESPGKLPEYTLVRTGDTTYDLQVRLTNSHIRGYGQPFGYRVSNRLTTPHVRPIFTGQERHSYTTSPEFVGPPGGEAKVYIEPFYCEEVPGDCGYDSQYRIGETPTFTATIYNSNQGVTVEADQESVNEGGSVTFTLTRIGGTPIASTDVLTVRVAVTQDGEFIQGTTPQTVKFAGFPDVHRSEAESTVTVTVETVDDDVHEVNGSITLTILEPVGENARTFYEVGDGGGGPSGTATVAVVSDDAPSLSIADAEAKEADGSVDFTVTVPTNYGEITVDWATSDATGEDAATEGQDYTSNSGTLRFLEAETSKTISVAVLDNAVHESDETFIVTLSNPSGAALADATATGTIRDDDPEALPVVSVSAAKVSVEEGEPATFTFHRQSEGASPLTLTLVVTETGDFIDEALENDDGVRIGYTPGSTAATVTIPANALNVTVQFSTEDDSQIEANGAIKINIAKGSGYSFADADSDGADDNTSATVAVVDNDLNISIADASASETDSTLTFTVSLSGASEEKVTVVATTADGTATSNVTVTATSLGRDFEAKSETLTFNASETEKQFTVSLVDDTFDELPEEFEVRLSQPSGNARLPDGPATGTITDNDESLDVGVYQQVTTVNENAENPVTFHFILTPKENSGTTAAEMVTGVHWTVSPGTATAGEDYVAAAGTQTTMIPAGVFSKTVEVPLLDDEVYEAQYETFTFSLDRADNLELDQDNASIEIRLRDNEVIQAVVTHESPQVAEGGDAVFIVTLSPYDTAVPVAVEYMVIGTATADDYTPPSGQLTISEGTTPGRITIPVLTDAVHDPGETLGILLSRATGGGRSIRSDALSTPVLITILDSNTLSASLASGPSASEGDDVEITIKLSVETDAPVNVNWEASDANGDQAAESGGVDYNAASGTVTIAAGSTSGTFKVSTTEDILVEGDETFSVTLSSAKKGADPQTATTVELAVSHITATIEDDDTAPSTITLAATPDRVDEDAGETELTVTATLDGTTRMANDVTVDLELGGSIAAQEDGSKPASVTLTISAGQASGTTTVNMTPDDDEFSNGERTVTIGGSADGFDVTEATVAITDDEVAPTGVTLTLSQDSVSESAGRTNITVTAALTGGAPRSEQTEIPLTVQGVSVTTTTSEEDEEEDGEITIAATSGDYMISDVTLTIPAGQDTGTGVLEFTPTNDNLAEGDETAHVSGTSQEGLEVTPALLTIVDDDPEPDGIKLSATPDSATEDDGEVQIQVTATLTGGSARTADTEVALSVHDVSAMAGTDYTVGSKVVVTIPARERQRHGLAVRHIGERRHLRRNRDAGSPREQ